VTSQEEVVRLEISMDEAQRVRFGHRLAGLKEQVDRASGGKRPVPLEEFSKGISLE
jgi:hypothetical protein